MSDKTSYNFKHTNQLRWIHELIHKGKKDYALFGFFADFQAHFGGFNDRKKCPDGNYMSKAMMAHEMDVELSHFKAQFKKLVDLGIISHARASKHPRAVKMTMINVDGPHQYLELVNSIKVSEKEQPVARVTITDIPAPVRQEPVAIASVVREPSPADLEREEMNRRRKAKRDAEMAEIFAPRDVAALDQASAELRQQKLDAMAENLNLEL